MAELAKRSGMRTDRQLLASLLEEVLKEIAEELKRHVCHRACKVEPPEPTAGPSRAGPGRRHATFGTTSWTRVAGVGRVLCVVSFRNTRKSIRRAETARRFLADPLGLCGCGGTFECIRRPVKQLEDVEPGAGAICGLQAGLSALRIQR